MLTQPDTRPDQSGLGTPSSLILKGNVLKYENQPDYRLTCKGRDNSVRWQPGERLHHLFEQRCDQLTETSDEQHLAVDSPQGQWTYTQLDQRANQLARYLRLKGVGPGETVGLLFDKSAHSYIAMLAVLKINAAYVPLDPAFPQDRIAFIARDAEQSLILTLSQYQSLTEDSRLPTVCVDAEAIHIDDQDNSRLSGEESGVPVSELCYIIYTSGSTGRPKGVPIDQASICNFVRVAGEVYGYTASDRVYQGLTIAFDFAVEEIWVPLIVGATLLPNQSGSSLLGSDLAEFLLDNKATAMCCVPTLLATIDEDLPDLRLLIVSGEACPQDLITRWYSPKRAILNAYGPTETTVTATLARSKPDEPVTIGKPLPTYTVIILELGTENVLPFGEEGEIAVAGAGVAQGYLNRDDQTRKAFIKDFLKIPNNPSGLIYRTGDLGLINENRDIEYRGRIDLQVKIRGYRIELTEIESVMLQLPQIEQAVVDTFEPLPGVKELVAYFTLKDSIENSFTQEALVNELRELLPNYMIPSYYEQLDTMPMMASDKADRKALPKPQGSRMNADSREFVKPQNQLESDIADVLCRLLKLDTVSVEDHFFDDLGANSLLMAQFSAKVRSELGIANFSMREIYTHPSIRQLAVSLKSSDPKQEPKRNNNAAYKAPRLNYILTGAAQLSTTLAMLYLGAFIFWEGFEWIMAAPGLQAGYGRSLLFVGLLFLLSLIVPVTLKWLLIGRFKAEEFPVWGLKYFMFWTVKTAMTANPMRAFVGTPIFTAYLKLLGARVSWNSLILTNNIPVCVDLLTVGDGAVISQNVSMTGYRAESGRIQTGSVTVKENTYVGQLSMLGVDSVMEAGSELAHASSLQRGQRLEAGKSYHGSPAQETENHYRPLENGRLSLMRKILFTLYSVLPTFVFMPLLFVFLHYFFGADTNGVRTPLVALLPTTEASHIIDVLLWTAVAFVAMIIISLVFVTLMPRFYNLFIEEGKVYPLYGIHYILQGRIQRGSNSKFFNYLFGDSSYIIYFLRAIGFKFKGIVQTGSNYGLVQMHENPFHCEIGKGTMISDGIHQFNTSYSISSFKVSKSRVGANNFFGNSVAYLPQSKTGENCLLGTKVMVPTNGPIKENTGLLGSPCFEIPRSVRRDSQFDHYKQEDVLRERLKLKNKSNIATMLLFLLTLYIPMALGIAIIYFTLPQLVEYKALYLASMVVMASLFIYPYFILIERVSLFFCHLKSQYCSIFDDYFWTHERHWKLSIVTDGLISAFNGTPFKGMVLRVLGMRVGRQLYDDGCQCSEKTLSEIGDYCTLNLKSMIQPHSLEDGTFKSDRIIIADECTIGKGAFVHYGVKMENGVVVESDSFLMKGEQPSAKSIWQGNPAHELLTTKKAEVELLYVESEVFETGISISVPTAKAAQ